MIGSDTDRDINDRLRKSPTTQSLGYQLVLDIVNLERITNTEACIEFELGLILDLEGWIELSG